MALTEGLSQRGRTNDRLPHTGSIALADILFFATGWMRILCRCAQEFGRFSRARDPWALDKVEAPMGRSEQSARRLATIGLVAAPEVTFSLISLRPAASATFWCTDPNRSKMDLRPDRAWVRGTPKNGFGGRDCCAAGSADAGVARTPDARRNRPPAEARQRRMAGPGGAAASRQLRSVAHRGRGARAGRDRRGDGRT